MFVCDCSIALGQDQFCVEEKSFEISWRRMFLVSSKELWFGRRTESTSKILGTSKTFGSKKKPKKMLLCWSKHRLLKTVSLNVTCNRLCYSKEFKLNPYQSNHHKKLFSS